MQLSRRQHGFTLLESMIAIVIVALGVLGVLGVQLRTLSDTQTSVRRAQAIRLIEDLAERVRTNPNALTTAVLSNYQLAWGDVKSKPPDCSVVAGCTAANLALSDAVTWKQTVMATMPLGDAAVFLIANAPATNTRTQLGVMISWRENERAADTDAEAAAYRAPFAVAAVATGGTGAAATVSCPDGRICHLQYVVPTLRCTPWLAGDPTNPQAICP